MLPINLFLSETSYIVDDFLDLLVSQVKLHHLRNFLQILKGQSFFFFKIYKIEHWPPSFSVKWITKFISKFFQEKLKINPFSIELISDLLKSFENELVLFIKTKSLSSVQNICNVAFSSVITIEIEHVKKIFTMLCGKDRVFSDYLFGKNCFSFFLCKFLTIDDHLNDSFDLM